MARTWLRPARERRSSSWAFHFGSPSGSSPPSFLSAYSGTLFLPELLLLRLGSSGSPLVFFLSLRSRPSLLLLPFPPPPSAHLHCLSSSLSHTHLAPSKTPLHRPSSVCTRNTNSKARRLQDTFVFPTWTPHNRAVKDFPRSCVCSTGRPPHGIRSN